ncbi:PadR family transcriptional regulator [Paenibacillus dokdonensis]|uniref:PadR family transcriptional regulator n=1 Tax=Paenibacillus dokdonensis TaxID=2567944 RepID=UPI0010A8E0CF
MQVGASSISSDLIRGNIDTIILRILCEGDNYGYKIIKSISKYSQGQYELKEPSLYTSLKRLESQGYITSYWGDESQGGRRKYYTVTPEGTTSYHHNVEAWKTAKRLIDQLIESGEGLN